MTGRLVCLWWLIALMGCNTLIADNDRGKLQAEHAEARIRNELKVGSPESEVKTFLVHQGWLFDFDAFQGRFASVVYRSPDGSCVVTAYIYIDSSKRMNRSEVKVSLKHF